MKRLLLTLLCLLFAYPCFAAEPIQLARMSPWVAGSVAATSCTEKDGQKTYYGYAKFEDANYKYLHSNFTPATSYTVHTLYLRLKKDANTTYSPNYPITAYICDDSSGHPGTCVASDNTVLANSIAYSSWDWYKFQFAAGVNLTTSVWHIQAMAGDLTTYDISWAANYSAAHASDWKVYRSPNGTDWTQFASNGYQFMFYLTECAE